MRRINSFRGGLLHGSSTVGGTTTKILGIFIVIAGAMMTSAKVFSIGPNLADFITSFDIALKQNNKQKAPVDYGYGPGLGIGSPRPNLVLGQTPVIPKAALAKLAVPNGGDHYQGYFAPPVPWPFIPIHMALMPDGRVMTFGRAANLALEARYVYDVWDPTLGTGPNAHTLLPNTTPGNTDIFCGAASLLGSGYGSGQLLIVGGAPHLPPINNTSPVSNNNVTLFNPKNDTLTASGTMVYPRWYPTIMTLRNDDKLVLGGAYSESVLVPTPEVYNVTSGWRALPGIAIISGGPLVDQEWFYPRAYVGKDGAVYLLQYDGRIFRLTTGGAGTMTDTGARMAPGLKSYPTVMYLPFKVLSVRANQIVQVVDLSVNPPVVTNLPNISKDRLWANGTLLADGGVLVTGGSGVNNELIDIDYQAVYIAPSSGAFVPGASASIPRLYHSAALLLPDGSVLTGGGGQEGPVDELNAEIYYPYYLYLNDGSGRPAPRPTIVSAPSTLKAGQLFSMTVGSNDQILGINLIRMGFTTHAFDPEQRRIPVPFVQNGATITAAVINSPESTPPGYYMLFVFNKAGTPSVATTVSMLQTVTTTP